MNLFSILFFFYDFFKIYFYRGDGKEKERERKHQSVLVSCAPRTGDPAHNPSMCPYWEWNLRSSGSQARAQSTELHQPVPIILYFSISNPHRWVFSSFQKLEDDDLTTFSLASSNDPDINILVHSPVSFWLHESICTTNSSFIKLYDL